MTWCYTWLTTRNAAADLFDVQYIDDDTTLLPICAADIAWLIIYSDDIDGDTPRGTQWLTTLIHYYADDWYLRYHVMIRLLMMTEWWNWAMMMIPWWWYLILMMMMMIWPDDDWWNSIRLRRLSWLTPTPLLTDGTFSVHYWLTRDCCHCLFDISKEALPVRRWYFGILLTWAYVARWSDRHDDETVRKWLRVTTRVFGSDDPSDAAGYMT